MSEAPAIDLPAFTSLVKARQGGAEVSSASHTIAIGGDSWTVRETGAFVLKGTLGDENDHPVDIFYSDDDAGVAKLNGTFAMVPAGIHDGLGGRHGEDRWSDNTVHKQPSRLTLTSINPPEYPTITKEFSIFGRRLLYTVTVANTTEKDLHTSVGQHFYLNMPQGLEGVELSSRDGFSPLDEPGVRQAVSEGRAQYWSGFDGIVDVGVPGVGRYHMESHAYITTDELQTPNLLDLGMLLWQRPGKKAICFEPVVGNENDPLQPFRPFEEVPNHELVIPRQASVKLRTIISLAD